MTSLPTNDGGAVLKRKLLQDPYLSCPGDPKDALKLYLPKWFLGFLNDMWTLVCDDFDNGKIIFTSQSQSTLRIDASVWPDPFQPTFEAQSSPLKKLLYSCR